MAPDAVLESVAFGAEDFEFEGFGIEPIVAVSFVVDLEVLAGRAALAGMAGVIEGDGAEVLPVIGFEVLLVIGNALVAGFEEGGGHNDFGPEGTGK